MKIIHIEGMMCPRCVAHVKKALEVLDPQVEVILEQNCAKIYADVADETLTAAVVEAGYEVTSIEN